MTDRFGRSCHDHHLELIVKDCPEACPRHHSHYVLLCPKGHECGPARVVRRYRHPSMKIRRPWDAFDSFQCWQHAGEPEIHTSCIYATADEDDILWTAEWLDEAMTGIAEQVIEARQERVTGRYAESAYAS